MPYIAGQRLLIAGEYREGGEPVPEAETESWRTLPDLVATGHLVWVDELPKPVPVPVPEPEPEPEPEPPEASEPEPEPEPEPAPPAARRERSRRRR